MSRFMDFVNFFHISNRVGLKGIHEIKAAFTKPLDYAQIEGIMDKKIKHDREELKAALKEAGMKEADAAVKEMEDVILAKKILKKLN